MVSVMTKKFAPYGGFIPTRIDTSSKANSFHENEAVEHKRKSFPVVYCPTCEQAWDKKSNMRYGRDFPMKRKLVHKTCLFCEDKNGGSNG